MNRRTFLTTAAAGSALPLVAQTYSDYTKDPRLDVAEGTFTAGSAPGTVFKGSPVVSGPAPEALTILQPLQRHATGYLEFALENESWQSRIGTVQAAFDAAARDTGVKPDAAFVRTFYDRVAPGIHGEFDGPAMLPLIAPRPLLAINGEIDPRTPMPGLKQCAEAARAAYRAAGAEEKFVLHVQPNTGHKVLPESMTMISSAKLTESRQASMLAASLSVMTVAVSRTFDTSARL